jgi:hypothetical protein
MSVVSVVCCQVEVPATGWSLVQRSPTECGVSKSVWSWSLEKWGGLGPQGAVEPLKKKDWTINFVISVCLSVRPFFRLCVSLRMEKLGSHWRDFHEIWYFSIFRNYVEKVQEILKSDKSNAYFKWRPMYIYDNISLNSSQNEKYFRQKL